ncbi:MAG: DUF3035 domain-containing protein [Octadecabacter sp.]|nr:DUF3035 domain-containing protein [Octadecabacter sp.]
MMTRLFICIFAMLALTACTSDDRGLRVLAGSGAGPDEFSVMPMAPLVMPTDTANLPSPTPGAGNRADPAPLADAVVALGGNANALVPNGVPVRDGALVNAAGRNGVDHAIRQTLASEDAAFRNRRSSFGLFRGRGRYFRVYARQALDAYAELTRFRNAGVATPSAPPQ